ncbi:MAG: DMP19 family protein [Firmicutes bacterium]|nr:DMP19 family protein [Bacillota bacterium]
MGLFGLFKRKNKKTTTQQSKQKRIIIDDAFIDGGWGMEIIEPLWFGVDIYNSAKEYEADLESFTLAQRYVFAIEWYNAEVNNGGHSQFYTNSTGIVWEDAMNGFKAIGADKHYELIKESAKRMGGNPSKTRNEREEEYEKHDPDFEDLDNKFYELENELEDAIKKYVRSNRELFYFDGFIKI